MIHLTLCKKVLVVQRSGVVCFFLLALACCERWGVFKFMCFHCTNPILQSSSSESHLVMKVPAFYETQKVNWHLMFVWHVYKGLPTIQILNQVNPVRALPTHFFKIQFNITSSLTFR